MENVIKNLMASIDTLNEELISKDLEIERLKQKLEIYGLLLDITF